MVSTIAGVPLGAVQTYHTECPPALPAWFGSPASLVAPTFEPLTLAELPDKPPASTKLSLAGGTLPMVIGVRVMLLA